MSVGAPRGRLWIVDALRALVAFATLTLLVAGVPYGLWWAGGWPWPFRIPSLDDITTALTAPDDGSLFIGALLVAGWVGWATFAVAVLVEIPAALRGVRAPRLPALGTQQRLAAVLVSAVAGMLTIGPVATAEPAPSHSFTTAVPPDDWRPVPTVPPEMLTGEQPQNHQEEPTKPDHEAEPDEEETSEHVVQRGDTLWDIAAALLGDPWRWAEIFEASKDTIQPDGRRLTHPDLIYPGWHLTIPAVTPGPDQASTVPDTGDNLAADPTASSSNHDGLVSNSSGDARDADTESAADTSPAAADERQPIPTGLIISGHNVAPAPTPSGEDAAECDVPGSDSFAGPATDEQDPDDDSDVAELVRTATGVGALLAAGVIGLLTTRRALQQRRRRAGQRLPQPTDLAAATELELRDVADATQVDFVDRALRTLAVRLSQRGQAPPPLRLARLIDDQLELYFEEPADLPPPFIADDERTTWMTTADADGMLDIDADDVPAPWPSLVTIGHDTDNAHIMLDLEHVGTLNVFGDVESCHAFVSALATELCTSRWADDIQVTFVGSHVDLEALQTGRVRHTTDVDRLMRELTARANADRELLRQCQTDSVAEARTKQTAAGAWTPEIVVVTEPLPLSQQQQLSALISQELRLAIAAVVLGPGSAGGTAIRIANPSTAVLEPHDLVLRPQQVRSPVRDRIIDLVTTADGELVGQPLMEIPLDQIPQSAVAAALESVSPTAADDQDLNRPPSGPSEVHGSRRANGETAPESTPTRHPRVLLLGEPDVVGAQGPLEKTKRNQAVQLACYLSLRPGRHGSAMDEAIWPNGRPGTNTRGTAVSRLRRWLGPHPDDDTYLPHATDDIYQFHRDVQSDWQDWCDILPDGLVQASSDDLWRALDLVRARPLSGRGASYTWADMHAHEMTSAIIDACHELAERALKAGDLRATQTAALRGLDIEPACELLWRDRLKAEARLGNRTRTLELIGRLRVLADELGSDLEDETIALIDQIVQRSRSS
ncbi:LysM peptidoglycan-binding domain-containing protein [Phytoactinopolyspora alkaliphila]|uniref:LysM peptidoglycan-binding domain-containing protein n=1 Tax=Phytoactinopolyspora alkaliphila TaxID=1783498 RepID=A0A6N9YPF5_9ACTN|nr:BTAD domain-containing putative transcriptional regulator [Phytoactinopolyspora alkaliphila]NED96862.1 LysM peptidoglycan-binding domain-containing protein [Phytoactinopolyspora alkaliphila]